MGLFKKSTIYIMINVLNSGWNKKTEYPVCKEKLLPDNKRKIIELLQTLNIEESEHFGDVVVTFMNKLYATGEYEKKKISKIEIIS